MSRHSSAFLPVLAVTELDRYIDAGLSVAEIAESAACSHRAVRAVADLNGIVLPRERRRGAARALLHDPAWLADLDPPHQEDDPGSDRRPDGEHPRRGPRRSPPPGSTPSADSTAASTTPTGSRPASTTEQPPR